MSFLFAFSSKIEYIKTKMAAQLNERNLQEQLASGEEDPNQKHQEAGENEAIDESLQVQSEMQENHEKSGDGEAPRDSSHDDQANENNTIDDAKDEPLSITTICYDFQKQIFNFLDPKSLLMMAGTCKHLQNAAATHFNSRYGKRDIWLSPSRRMAIHTDDYGAFDVCGLELCLPFIRVFGAEFSHLRVFDWYGNDNQNVEHLYQYINQYCADSLKTIHISSQKMISTEVLQKPFKNAEKAVINGCVLVGNWLDWFPTLNDLHICGRCFDNLPFTTLLNAINRNSSIVKLKVDSIVGVCDNHVSMNELSRLIAEHQLMVELTLSYYCVSVEDVIQIIGQMKSLKQFKFRTQKVPAAIETLQRQLPTEWQSNVGKIHGLKSTVIIELKR